MSQDAEEKQLPASDKKLRDSRRKGQVSHSRDLITGVTLLAALAYLFFVWPSAVGHLDELIQTVAVSSGTFEERVAQALHHSAILMLFIMAPLAGVIVVSTVFAGIIATQGPVFSFELIKPQFDNISPVKGLKKIISLRNVIEFAKSLAKVVFLAGLFVLILLAWMQPLFETPACGETCIEPTVRALLVPLGVAAALGFIVIGIVDIPLQRWLFLRDMRMTRTEFKRERKDIEGDPLLRQELRRLRREAISNRSRLGVESAVVIFVDTERAVGLRYVRNETPVPVVVAKGQGDVARSIIADARQRGIPIVEDTELTEPLFTRTALGGYVGERSFSPLVKHLVRLGLT